MARDLVVLVRFSLIGVLMMIIIGRDEDHEEDEEEGDMDVDSAKGVDEVALASVAASALGRDSNDIADALRELDMDNYDDDGDDGISRITR